jgi:hypothetical protein
VLKKPIPGHYREFASEGASKGDIVFAGKMGSYL